MTKEQLVLAISPHYEELNNRRWLCRCSGDRWKAIHLTGGGPQSLSKLKGEVSRGHSSCW